NVRLTIFFKAINVIYMQ
ncbi:hypothetical protein D047_4771B, partial [Vibrio parahaemolyticus VPTS-2010_2]